MGLIAHYPLNGNAKDALGRYDGEVVNDLQWVDGKFGVCSDTVNTLAGGYVRIPHNAELSQKVFGVSEHFAVSCWVRPRQYVSYGNVWGKASGGSFSNTTVGLWVITGGLRFVVGSNVEGNPSGSVAYIGGGFSPSLNDWHHIVCQCDNGFYSLWVDGQYLGGQFFVSSVERSENTFPIIVSGGREEARNEGFDGNVADVRFYDAPLSKREIRDLYQGKVIDFPFNRPISTTTNLITDPLLKNGLWPERWGSPTVAITGTYQDAPVIRVTATSDQTSGFVTPYEFFVDAGETVTVSMDVRSNDVTSLNYIYLMRSGFSNTMFATVSVSPSFTRVCATLTNHTAATCAILIARNTLLTGQWFEVSRVQVEKKPFTTEFVEGSRAGRLFGVYPNTIPTVLDETVHPEPLDDGYRFDGNSSITVQDAPAITGDCSIAFWIKPETTSFRQTFYEKGYGSEGTINFETNAAMRYYFGTGSGNSTPYDQLNSPVIPLNQWTHAVIVRNLTTGVVTWFINGEQATSTTTSFTASGVSNIPFRIGTGYTDGFVGSLRDMKQFATALSSDEVRELYQQRASLDAQGNFYAGLIVDSVGYQKTWGDGSGVGFLTNNLTNISTDGTLRYTTATHDPMIVMYPIGNFDPNTYKYLQLKYRVVSGNVGNVEVFFTNAQYTGATGSQRVATGLVSDGAWHVATLDMSAHTHWTHSSVTGWRLDAGTVAGVTLELGWVRLVSDAGAISVKSNKTAGAFSELGITDGLVAYYPLTKDAKDYSGNGNHGVVNGAVPVAGGFDGKGAYSFDGVNGQYIRASHSPMNPVSHTISVWFKKRAHTKTSYPIFLSYSLPYLTCDGEGHDFRVSYAAPSQINASGGPIAQLNTWYHVCATFAEDGVRLYVDGQMVAHNNTPCTSSGGLFDLGRHYDRNTYQVDGEVCNVKIFNRALTPEEIAIEYKRTGPTKMTQYNGQTFIQGQFKEVTA